MNKEIDLAFLEKCEQSWAEDAAGQQMANAIIQNGPMLAGMNYEAVRKLPFTFSVDAWNGNVTDQVTSLRCWAFASLNNLRQHAIEHLDMKDRGFELSQDFVYFYDQLEKSNRYLNKALELLDEPLDSPKMGRMLHNPIMDNGQWYMCADIVDKYGIVPKSVMPDAQVSGDTRYVTRILSAKLKTAMRNLRAAHAKGASAEELGQIKEEELKDIYGILCRFLGAPCKTFDWSYQDTKGQTHYMTGITPKDFFKAIGVNNDDYMFIIHHPSDKYAFMKGYVQRDDLTPGHDVLLNVDMPLIKQMVIEQLKGGEQVVMGCDVAKLSHKVSGYMDSELYDFNAMFGCKIIDMDKKEHLEYKNIKGTHIMAFAGVNLDEQGRPDRWKVQNSYGQGMGINGYYVMADNWFDTYVVSVVINKKYAPEEVVKAYESTPERMADGALY
ncbi:MAG: aminopeptidase [Firmicutes bacterium]|nr:aminopeptidase [Bacillota bacterium]